MYIDPGYFENAKVLMAGARAAQLHMACIGYAQREGTAGFVPLAAIRRLDRDWKRLSARLVAAVKPPPSSGRGLLVAVAAGFLVHDFGGVPDEQSGHALPAVSPPPTVDDAARLSNARAEAGRRGGRRSGAARRGKREDQLGLTGVPMDAAPHFASHFASMGGRGGSVSGSVSGSESPLPVGADPIADSRSCNTALDVPEGWRLDHAWVKILGVLPQGAGMLECSNLLREYAAHAGKPIDAVAAAALGALGALMAARQARYRSYKPYALVDNWERVQRVMAGLDVPTAEAGADPQRGQLPVAKVEEDLGALPPGTIVEERHR